MAGPILTSMRPPRIRHRPEEDPVGSARKVMLILGLVGLGFWAMVYCLPSFRQALPEFALYFLLLGPVFFLLGLCPRPIVKWAAGSCDRIVIFTLGAVLAIASFCGLRGAQTSEWRFVLLGAACAGLGLCIASICGSRRIVDRIMSGL